MIIAIFASFAKLIYMPDQLGSVRDVLDGTSGTRVASYDFTPYGALARSFVTNGTDYQYAGLFQHTQSTLNLSATRAQDGATGRWTNRDPIVEAGGPNLYSYVSAGTIRRIDPMGLTWKQTMGMFYEWATGTAPDDQWFGPDTKQTRDMREDLGVQKALQAWANKNSNNCSCNGGNSSGNQTTLLDYGVSFGLKGLWNAGTNPTQQYVGSYTVNIYPDQSGNVRVVLMNTTSLTSFFYGIWPNSWNLSGGSPGGNFTQYYTWTQAARLLVSNPLWKEGL